MKIFSDGASRNNPGKAAWAYILLEDDKIIHRDGKYMGIASNNVAEYNGIKYALEEAKRRNVKDIEIYSDSQLAIKQLKGEWRVKAAGIKPLYREVSDLCKSFNSLKLTHVRREHKYIKICDTMCNELLDGEK